MVIRDMRPENGKPYYFQRQGLHDWAEMLYGSKLLVEVGSWKGESAVIFSDYASQVVCIDPWEGGLPAGTEHSMDDVFEEFKRNVAGCRNVCWYRKRSVEAAKCFPIESIDAVYIDASHIYQNVLNDLNAWIPVVKGGGILGGHDYNLEGVKRAVDEVLGPPEWLFEDNSWRIIKN